MLFGGAGVRSSCLFTPSRNNMTPANHQKRWLSDRTQNGLMFTENHPIHSDERDLFLNFLFPFSTILIHEWRYSDETASLNIRGANHDTNSMWCDEERILGGAFQALCGKSNL